MATGSQKGVSFRGPARKAAEVVQAMRDGEVKIVAKRLREVLSQRA